MPAPLASQREMRRPQLGWRRQQERRSSYWSSRQRSFQISPASLAAARGRVMASDAFGRIWQPPAWSSLSLVRCGRSRSVCLAPFDLTLSRCAPGVPGRSERPDYLSAAVDPSFGVEAIGHGQPRNGCQKREMCLHQLWICGAACHGRSCCSVWTPLRRFRPGCRFTLNFATVRLLPPGLRRFEKLCLWPGAAWMHTAGGGAI